MTVRDEGAPTLKRLIDTLPQEPLERVRSIVAIVEGIRSRANELLASRETEHSDD
jgi:hypothetical protein